MDFKIGDLAKIISNCSGHGWIVEIIKVEEKDIEERVTYRLLEDKTSYWKKGFTSSDYAYKFEKIGRVCGKREEVE
jgi:hypothetical protein